MNVPDLSIPEIATTLAGFATLYGVARTVWTSRRRAVPFTTECECRSLSDHYLLGPDGEEQSVPQNGNGIMPVAWIGSLVSVRLCATHRQVHSFYLRPVKGELFKIVIPTP